MSDRRTSAGPTASLLDRLVAMGSIDLLGGVRMRGVVAEVGDGVAKVVGLTEVGSDALVTFDSGALGIAFDLTPHHTSVVLLSGGGDVCVGQGAHSTGRLPALPAGADLLGRVVDSVGQPLDDLPAPRGASRAVFCDPPKLSTRAAVERPLLTGVMAIDAAIPIGRGQRQLILGDRNVGKTALALDMVVAQRDTDVVCVYVVIGQPLSRVLALRQALLESGALAHTVVVAAEASESPAMQYLAPYAGTSIAEHFRDAGRDALVVYDDLTKHADAYRELALLLERPPGREAFPGDIFYIHGELLERASALSKAAGGGSVTAFPIVETTDNDISAYIPTNLISITDGQVFLDTARFERNHRPAIDIGKSVSRIGGVAQPDGLRAASKSLRIHISRFESLEAITRVGLDVDPKTQAVLHRGRILRELLRQPQLTPRSVAAQAIALTVVDQGWVDDLEPPRARDVIWRAAQRAEDEVAELTHALDAGESPDPAAWGPLEALVAHVRATLAEPAP